MGIVTRIVQCSSTPRDLFAGVMLLAVEVVAAQVSLSLVQQALFRRMERMDKFKDRKWRQAAEAAVLTVEANL